MPHPPLTIARYCTLALPLPRGSSRNLLEVVAAASALATAVKRAAPLSG